MGSNIIKINDNLPGIVGLLETYAASGKKLRELAQFLLVDPSPLSRRERELIAVTVSVYNNCEFCAKSHLAVLLALLDKSDMGFDAAFHEFGAFASKISYGDSEDVSEFANFQMRFSKRDLLLGRTAMRVATLDPLGLSERGDLSDQELHDTVLIASSFCMFNRYVSALNPDTGTDESLLRVGRLIVENGYARS